jgi:hypothetical protein
MQHAVECDNRLDHAMCAVKPSRDGKTFDDDSDIMNFNVEVGQQFLMLLRSHWFAC